MAPEFGTKFFTPPKNPQPLATYTELCAFTDQEAKFTAPAEQLIAIINSSKDKTIISNHTNSIASCVTQFSIASLFRITANSLEIYAFCCNQPSCQEKWAHLFELTQYPRDPSQPIFAQLMGAYLYREYWNYVAQDLGNTQEAQLLLSRATELGVSGGSSANTADDVDFMHYPLTIKTTT